MSSATSTARRARLWKRPISAGNDVLFDIDWQGAQQIAVGAGCAPMGILPAPLSLPPPQRVPPKRL